MNKQYLALVIIGVAVLLAVFALTKNPQPVVENISSFEECKNAGYPIMESYPEQCRTPDGQVFVNKIQDVENPIVPSYVEFNKSQVFKVNSNLIFSDGLQLTLKEINDSRCKPDVQCVWAGEISALFSVVGGDLGFVSKEVRLGTTNNKVVNLEQYEVTLESATEDEVTIVISKK